jgi:heme/copper-type cytochrome/quinol oxidase subunit 2
MTLRLTRGPRAVARLVAGGLVAGSLWVLLGPAAQAAGTLAPEQVPIRIEISREGFEPSELRLRKGETVRLEVTTADVEHCFAVDELRVEKRVVPGKATSFELTPDRAGRFELYCCLEPDPKTTKERGLLIVTE